MNCPNCDSKGCPGPSILREFKDWNDLAAHADEETLVKWANQLSDKVEQTRHYGKKYRTKQQIMAKLVKQFLDPDELAAIAKTAGGE